MAISNNRRHGECKTVSMVAVVQPEKKKIVNERNFVDKRNTRI